MNFGIKALAFAFLCGAGLFSCDTSQNLSVDDAALRATDGSDGNWLTYGLDYAETRYSPLSQINAENISELGLAWDLDLGTKRGIETTPLVVNSVMYLTGPWSKVFAVNAKDGSLIWEYDPQVSGSYGERGCCDVVNRGVAFYEGSVFVGAFDGRLISLNAETGKPNWEVMTVDKDKPYTITGAPRVVKGKAIIGNGGAEFGVRGYFTAYDAKTGDQAWRFYTVPGNPSNGFENETMEMAAKTWTGEWWKYGGGGTAWDNMAYDPDLNLLYVGTGNGSPWDRNQRSPDGGDNLFLSSILAINPDNGELQWYYQTTPGDSWDFTATQHMILADLEIEGQTRKVLMQAPKNGFFYVLDRTNGELISAEKFTYVNWAKGIDSETDRPIEEEWARYKDVNAMIAPNFDGGHNWQPMTFDKKRNLVFLPARKTASVYGQDKSWVYNERGFGTGIGWNLSIGEDPSKPTIKDHKFDKLKGVLIAWDPIKQEAKWRIEQTTPWSGGLLSTAGDLVFIGTPDGFFKALDPETGEVLWQVNLQSGILGSPVSYSLDGEQYVSIAVGWGGGYGMKNKHTPEILPGHLYTFKIGGEKALPQAPEIVEKQIINPEWESSEGEFTTGETLFWQYCGPCHVVNGGGGGVAPDFAYSPMVGNAAFNAVVLKGALLESGMPNFGDRLTEKETHAIQTYIIEQVRMVSK
ncbi:PQQ-dependent dehydrogenase, methanol/ethanol family [Jiulongibacter sediminis]|jgi:quinohemoprotein ethanol dehydrogenase|uniref:PQQ-dependent dehydrogenase, methanol/ethanol family n=1 Tax=Jiulongibacter sediminis TaxID=1605367 RepID=UPI0026EA4744|nr:PQQ-dependent dehydrogenase, methanol/ethanol family [Jiulongibacter sediminis]